MCRRVPEHAPATFHEAVQSFWLLHYALFSTGTHISCGRFDQFLVPTLHHDLDTGALTLEQAQELIDCVWIRFNDRGQICRENFYRAENEVEPAEQARSGKTGMVIDKGPQSWTAGHRKRFQYASDAADAINHFGQNLLLSGIRPDGNDGTNPLTYICLNSLEKFAFTSPVVTIRLHRASPPALVERAAEVMKTGSGMPYVNNDDVLIPAYTELGVTLPDARDYANSNCWETMIEGKSDQELIRGMNFLLFLELALHRGQSSVHGQMGPDTGDPRAFATFDDLMDAWQQQADYQLKTGIDYIGEGIANGTLEHSNHGKYSFNPLLSALTEDCIQNEQDVIRGGARYTIWHVMGEAVANAIDSMAAIKQMVYVERSLSMDDLLTALDNNWEGYANLRARLIARAPKFANDNDFADELGQKMMSFFIAKTRLHAARYRHVRTDRRDQLLSQDERGPHGRGRAARPAPRRQQPQGGSGHTAPRQPRRNLCRDGRQYAHLHGDGCRRTQTGDGGAGKIPSSARPHGRLVGLLCHVEPGAADAPHPARRTRPRLATSRGTP